MTIADTINATFLEFLHTSFSACEWYGLVCRCFGPHLTELPKLDAQAEYVKKTAEWAYHQPINRFFFEELLRLRPQHRECIYIRMDELELTIRRRLEDEAGLAPHAAGAERFVSASNGTYRDVLSGVPHHHFQMDVGHLERAYQQQVYEDILLLSQLPIRSFQKVTFIDWKDNTINIYSTALGEPLNILQLASEQERYLILLAEALDAAHQRDVFHGAIQPEQLRYTDTGELILGGFGEAALNGTPLTLLDDHKAMADLLEQIFPNGQVLESFCEQLRSGQWNMSMLELVMAVQKSFEESDVLPIEERPAKLILDSPNRISVRLGFQNSVHTILLRKEGLGPLDLDVASLPPWLSLVPPRIDPNVQEQQLELTVLTKQLKEGANQFTWTIKNKGESEVAIDIEAKRSQWLMPALVLFVFVAIVGLLILGRLAS